MKATEMKQVAVDVIKAAVTADPKVAHDDIKMAMFNAKIPFSKLNSLFRTCAIELKLIVDPKIVTEGVTKAVAETAWDSCETWEDVEGMVAGCVEDVPGSTHARVLTLMRKFVKDEEIDLPKPVKAAKASRARGGAIAKAIAAVFATNSKASKADVYAAVLPTVKADKNAYDVMVMHYNLCFACANGLDLDAAIEATKGEAIPQVEVEVAPVEDAPLAGEDTEGTEGEDDMM